MQSGLSSGVVLDRVNAEILKGYDMTTAKPGDTVRIHYKGTLDDGTVFDSSEGRDPLEFVVGSGMIVPGLDVAIPGMAVGDQKTVRAEMDQAYGPRNDDAVQSIPRDQMQVDFALEAGMQLQMQTQDGRAVAVTVAEVTEEAITIDTNHPLAGHDLTFAIEMVEIEAA